MDAIGIAYRERFWRFDGVWRTFRRVWGGVLLREDPTPTPKLGMRPRRPGVKCVCVWAGYGGPTPTPKFGMRPRRPRVRCFGVGVGPTSID